MGVETVNSAILWLAILFFVIGLGLMIARGALNRDKVDTLYGVGQIKSRQVKFREMMTGLLLVVVGFVLLGMWWLLTAGIGQRTESDPLNPANLDQSMMTAEATLPPPIVATDTAVYTPTPTMIILATATGDGEATLPPPPTIASTAVPLPTPETVEVPSSAKVNIEFVNVRVQPALNAEILAILAQKDNEILGVYDETEERDGYTWRQIETYAGTGWVVEEYLTFIED